MATEDETVTMASRRLPPSKRRMSRDIVLPVMSNFTSENTDAGKLLRGDEENHPKTTLAPENQRRVTFAKNTEAKEGGTSLPASRHSRVAGGENKGAIPRPKRYVNKPKPKSTPAANGRKKKREFKVEVPEPVTTGSPCEEPMEVDNPAMAISAILSRVPDTVTNIDDHMDLFLSPEYAQDIVNYMQARESKMTLPSDFLSKNPDVTSQMRAILMDWMIQVQAHEQMEDETLQLAVRLIDQYLARALVPLNKLQLVGITGLLLAAKFVERFPPAISTLCALTANTYVTEEVLEMERSMLVTLKFDVSLPLPQFFLDRYMRVHAHYPKVEQLALYLVDLCLPSVHFVPVAPSVMAASALYLARKVYQGEEQPTWTQALAFYTKYTDRDLAPSVRLLAKMLQRASISKYQGARQKHAEMVPHGSISMDPLLDNHPALQELADDLKN